jgi:hypothetical protein
VVLYSQGNSILLVKLVVEVSLDEAGLPTARLSHHYHLVDQRLLAHIIFIYPSFPSYDMYNNCSSLNTLL